MYGKDLQKCLLIMYGSSLENVYVGLEKHGAMVCCCVSMYDGMEYATSGMYIYRKTEKNMRKPMAQAPSFIILPV